MIRSLAILLLSCACINLQAQVNIITTIAGKDTASGFTGDGGPAIAAKLNNPENLCLDSFGNMYIADASNHRVRKITASTGIITTIAGNGLMGYSGDGIAATSASLFFPTGICIDTLGDVFISDVLNYRIRKIAASTGIITTVAGNGNNGSSGDGGLAVDAEFGGVTGICLDRNGNIYLADNDNNKIRKVEISTGKITTIAGTGGAGYIGDGGLAINAKLNQPGQPFIDISGNIIFTDIINNVVRKVDILTGVITTIAGTGIQGYSGNGGPAINADLNQPAGLYIDNENNMLISEYWTGTIRKIDAATGNITTIAGTGTIGYSGDGGPALDAKLAPVGIWVDKYGELLIADEGNHVIRKVNNAVGVKPNTLKGELKVFPNPAKDELQITGVTENTKYRMLNIAGMCLQHGTLHDGDNILSMQYFAPGIYILEVTAPDGERSMNRVVKE